MKSFDVGPEVEHSCCHYTQVESLMRRAPDVEGLGEVPFWEFDGIGDSSERIQKTTDQPGKDLEFIDIPLVHVVSEMEQARCHRVPSHKEGNSQNCIAVLALNHRHHESNDTRQPDLSEIKIPPVMNLGAVKAVEETRCDRPSYHNCNSCKV